MNIYFGFTVAGDRSQLHTARRMVELLKAMGHDVLTRHLVSDQAAELDRAIAPQAVYERDMNWLRQCDIFIADVSGSSFGLGYEAGYVLGSSLKKAVLFYRREAAPRISLLITGNTHPNCRLVPYSAAGEMEAQLRSTMGAGSCGVPMPLREEKKAPQAWRERRATVRHGWATPFHALEWVFEWIAYGLSRWAFLEVLEYLGILSVLVAVIFYFAEAGDRRQQKHYQAWHVINTAQGKGGSGGRIEALQELNEDHQPLVGLDAPGAFLQGVRLPGANLLRCNLEATDLRDSHLTGADLEYASLRSANFRGGDLHLARLRHADLEGADLVGANLAGCDLTDANLKNADLRNIDISGLIWRDIKSIEDANIYGVRHPPEGFLPWALAHGARSTPNGPE
jgi:hypothetical protein